MKPVEPIYTAELFPPLGRELLAVLRDLPPADWARPTVCGPWSVKDVTAHLLGGSLGRLWKREQAVSLSADPEPGYDELVALINRNNDLWVKAAERISPEILIEFLELTDRRLYDHFRNLDPHAPAPISVAWAGEGLSPNWFDIAREYTEKWLHQQHIREAVGRPLLLEPQWLFPVLDTFLRALPHAYRNVDALDGASISVAITGGAGGEWTLVREGSAWQLFSGGDVEAACRVQLDQDLAWRLFTKGVSRHAAAGLAHIEGDARLGEQALDMICIMA